MVSAQALQLIYSRISKQPMEYNRSVGIVSNFVKKDYYRCMLLYRWYGQLKRQNNRWTVVKVGRWEVVLLAAPHFPQSISCFHGLTVLYWTTL